MRLPSGFKVLDKTTNNAPRENRPISNRDYYALETFIVIKIVLFYWTTSPTERKKTRFDYSIYRFKVRKSNNNKNTFEKVTKFIQCFVIALQWLFSFSSIILQITGHRLQVVVLSSINGRKEEKKHFVWITLNNCLNRKIRESFDFFHITDFTYENLTLFGAKKMFKHIL